MKTNERILPNGSTVFGVDIDPETRCRHYHSEVDRIAIKFACCNGYYSCFECHQELTDHEPKRWPLDRFDEPAVLCGACGSELTVNEYAACDSKCPKCGAEFNPGCKSHWHLYFES